MVGDRGRELDPPLVAVRRAARQPGPARGAARRARLAADRRTGPRAAARGGSIRRPSSPASSTCSATASRSAVWSASCSISVTSAIVPSSSARPTAIARAARWPASDSRSIRSMNASRRLCGAAPRPSSPAASSSSVYSGLPSLRANSRSTSSGVGASPRMSVERLGQLGAVERDQFERGARWADARARTAAGAAGGGGGARRCGRSGASSPAPRAGCGPGTPRTSAWSGRPSACPRGSAPPAAPRRAGPAAPARPRTAAAEPRDRGARRPGPASSRPGTQRRQLRPAALAQLVEHRVTGAHQRPQRPQQRRVGKLGIALLDGLAPQDDRVLGVALLELPYQPGLADARFTAEQHQRRTLLPGVAQDRLELRQLADATDEVTAREPAAHDGSIAIATSTGGILHVLGLRPG